MKALLTGQVRLDVALMPGTNDIYQVTVTLSGDTYSCGTVRKTNKGFSTNCAGYGYKTLEDAAKAIFLQQVSTYDIKQRGL